MGTAGRGELLEFDYEAGTGILRHHRRGGFVRHFIEDLYLLDNRARKELELHWAVYRAGLAVPEPLGACWRRSGPFFRGWIATRRLDAVDLAVFLRRASKGEGESRCRAAGVLVANMHALGVNHPDLQTGNILVGACGEYLIDFDNAVQRERLSAGECTRNLARLKRSFVKHTLSLSYYEALKEGYREIRK